MHMSCNEEDSENKKLEAGQGLMGMKILSRVVHTLTSYKLYNRAHCLHCLKG